MTGLLCKREAYVAVFGEPPSSDQEWVFVPVEEKPEPRFVTSADELAMDIALARTAAGWMRPTFHLRRAAS